MHRRDFLRLGGLAGIGLGLDAAPAAPASCIVVWLPGGLSHLDTFDMKPDAPAEIRGEFRPIRTCVPGIRICEHLPRTARIMDKLTIVRSMRSGDTNHERAERRLGLPRFVAAASGGDLTTQCAVARRMVERGSRLVCVGRGAGDYDTHTGNFRRLRDELLPSFDRAFSSLVADLDGRGLLDTTLVAALTEFGRTPRINAQGGRDHHSSAWSVVLAGGGLQGGRVLGATDRTGTEVAEMPVSPEDLMGAISSVLGLQPEPHRPGGTAVLSANLVFGAGTANASTPACDGTSG
jgi:uncharacterized protein (DUF1501 family)